MSFRLYPVEQHFWSFQDHAAVLSVMARLHPKTVLEFGPGSSTLALIEGGAEHIDTVEDDPDWAQVYEERLQGKFPVVTVHRYAWGDPLSIPAVDVKQYDMGLIDGPFGTTLRPVAIAYALDRCDAVLVPLEECKPGDPGLRQAVTDLATRYGKSLELMETGPLSGAFGLIGASC